MAPELKPCGTRAAYERHRIKGERACDPCLAANRADNKPARDKLSRCRSRAYRKLAAMHRPEYLALREEEAAREPGTAARSRVRQRAYRRLAKNHPATFRALMDEELARDGER